MPDRDWRLTINELLAQWINPGDVFSILLLLPSDVIARALAQLTGNGLAPVSFSFGMDLCVSESCAVKIANMMCWIRMGGILCICHELCCWRKPTYADGSGL